MEAKAIAKTLRVSPIKARLVADLIRGKEVNVALNILNNMNSKPARLTKKVLDSAIANAVNNLKLDVNTLYVKESRVDAGPVLKRFRPRARGSASRIRKPTSHILVEVAKPAKTEKEA